jgi:hypothetical protein
LSRALLAWALGCGLALAAWSADASGQGCAAFIQASEAREGIPTGLLGAIARVESGGGPYAGDDAGWPWTLNATTEGGQYFARKDDAVAAVRALLSRGVRSVDVGCMQMNLKYHPDAFGSLGDAFDPEHNVAAAARFLKELHATTGSWEEAVARYHNSDAVVGADYRNHVYAAWHGAPALHLAASGAHDIVVTEMDIRDAALVTRLLAMQASAGARKGAIRAPRLVIVGAR